MLKVLVPKNEAEYFDPITETFVSLDQNENKEVELCLEHSLYSLSKWESKWHKPFIREGNLESEEFLDYIKCMTVWPKNVPDGVYLRLTEDNLKAIVNYISDPMTATTFSDRNLKRAGKPRRQVVTAELLYHAMVIYGIPFECEKWHLNRLQALIHVCEVKEQDPKKNRMSRRDIMAQNKSLNAARRAQHKTKG